MKAPFTCCGHWNHERRIVQGIVFCVCVDCAGAVLAELELEPLVMEPAKQNAPEGTK